MNEIKEYTIKLFEDIKHIDEFGNEYWLARELQKVLEYTQWRRFENVIDRAKIACKNSNVYINEQFAEVGKLSINVNGGQRRITDYKLSRYACYLIAQNGDSRKKVIALAQTYFAIQTRKQELSEKEYNELTEDEKRLYRRNQARKGNYNLNQTAVNSGVKDLARFHNAGYKGLYNGETADDIFKRKKLRYREDILDNMGSEELADNIFRIAQTYAKLKRENVDNEYTANSVHYEVGREVRNSIKRLGGIMPEDLPMPNKSLKEIGKERKHDIIIAGCDYMLIVEVGFKLDKNLEYYDSILKQNGLENDFNCTTHDIYYTNKNLSNLSENQIKQNCIRLRNVNFKDGYKIQNNRYFELAADVVSENELSKFESKLFKNGYRKVFDTIKKDHHYFKRGMNSKVQLQEIDDIGLLVYYDNSIYYDLPLDEQRNKLIDELNSYGFNFSYDTLGLDKLKTLYYKREMFSKNQNG